MAFSDKLLGDRNGFACQAKPEPRRQEEVMRGKTSVCCLGLLVVMIQTAVALANEATPKPSPDQVIRLLKEGNARFVAGKAVNPHRDAARVALAAKEDQGKHAYATVLSCSDSRVPVEVLFDAGVMDIFVVRVAGNVVRTDEAGSIEYGMAHVNTPVLVVMGHTQCGAVNAVIAEMEGKGHELERNIPPLVAPIVPAVKRARAAHPDAQGKDLGPLAVRENVWQAVGSLFMVSPAVRNLVKRNKATVVGAVYEMESGKVRFLPEDRVGKILAKVEQSPKKAVNALFEKPSGSAR